MIKDIKKQKKEMYVNKDLLVDFEIDFYRRFSFLIEKYEYITEMEKLLSRTSNLLSGRCMTDNIQYHYVYLCNSIIKDFQQEMDGMDYLSFIIDYTLLIEETITYYETKEYYEQCHNLKGFLDKLENEDYEDYRRQ